MSVTPVYKGGHAHDTMGDISVRLVYIMLTSGSDLDPISVSQLQLCLKFSDCILFLLYFWQDIASWSSNPV